MSNLQGIDAWRRNLLALALGSTLLPSQAQAATRLIVPAAAGGATDLLSRLFAQYLSEDAPRPVIAENRPGAGGVIGTQIVAKAPADGSVLLMGALSHVVNSALMDNVPYDPLKDFTPIAKLLSFGSVLVVHPSIPVNDMKQFIAYAKLNPNKLIWALGATGTSQQLAGVLLAREAGIQFVTVPYKGGGPAMNDMLGGHASFMIESIPTAVPYIQSGRIRALGVTGGQRSSGLPDVPTIGEAALPGFNVESWFALLGPAGLPNDLALGIYQRLQKIMARPSTQEKLVSMGARPELLNPTETRAFMESESRRWIPIIKEANIRAT